MTKIFEAIIITGDFTRGGQGRGQREQKREEGEVNKKVKRRRMTIRKGSSNRMQALFSLHGLPGQKGREPKVFLFKTNSKSSFVLEGERGRVM